MQRATVGTSLLADFTFDPIGRLLNLFQDAIDIVNDLTIGETFNPAS